MNPPPASPRPAATGRRYAQYVLFVLVLVYVCNFVDRLIISILAEDIKAELHVSDSQLGFIAGTAFAVFYALFGLPLGRLADIWIRKRLIAIGLALWSALTVLSGTAASFLQLAVYRCGVGIGEASASPAAFSMLSDYFPQRIRATVLAVYTSGAYVGMGLGIFLGGWIVDAWKEAFPDPAAAPFGLSAWQAAFVIVGAPGVLLALWVATLREPVRGEAENISSDAHPHPWRETWRELMAIVPPFSVANLLLPRAPSRVLALNIGSALALTALGACLSRLTGDPAQWLVFGIGLYASLSWIQNLALRDPPTFAMTFGCRAFVFTIFGFCSINFVAYSLAVWIPSFFIRAHGMDVGEVGMIVGLSMVVAGGVGINLGGFAADAWKARNPRGRLYLGLTTMVLTVPASLVLFSTDNAKVALVMNFFVAGLTSMWVGPASSTIMDLVLPRMRAVAAAFYFLLNVLLGLAIGPYLVGMGSDWLTAAGRSPGDALQLALIGAMCTLAIPIGLLLVAVRHIEDAERSRIDRARLAGEPGL